MIYQRITFSTIFLLLGIGLMAQSRFNLSVKAGLISGEDIVQSRTGNLSIPGNLNEKRDLFLAMAFSLPVKGNFRLGAEAGYIAYNTHLGVNSKFENEGLYQYAGNYQINQVFLSLVPECRLQDWFYVNSGFGLYFDTKNEFVDGTLTAGSEVSALAGKKFKRTTPLGMFMGAGICPKIGKKIALQLEARYLMCPANIKTGEEITMGYKGPNFNAGLMYKF
jgi:opacity protein-like surface antigen